LPYERGKGAPLSTVAPFYFEVEFEILKSSCFFGSKGGKISRVGYVHGRMGGGERRMQDTSGIKMSE
jgi:hypothetical protein